MNEIVFLIFATIGMITVGAGLIALVVGLLSCGCGGGSIGKDSFIEWAEKNTHCVREY